MITRGFIATLIVVFTMLLPVSAQNGRIALVQSSIAWGDPAANITAFDSRISSVEGCDMIIFPELFVSGCDMQRRSKYIKDSVKFEIAQLYPSVLQQMKNWAKQSGAVVVGSTIYERDSLFYNRLLAVYPAGEYYHYDKHNCFKKGAFTSGDDHLVITVNNVRYATYICYDLRFEEWSRNDNRDDAAIYISNWPKSRDADWNSLLSTRASENGAYVIGVNCAGEDLAGVEYIGSSSLYSPDGVLVDKCSDGEDQILIVELSVD